jgi:hypothetical protein
MGKDDPMMVKHIAGQYLKETPNNEMDVIITEGQNGRITADMGGNRHIRLGQSVESKDSKTPNYTMRENFPATKVKIEDRGGDTDVNVEGRPMHYYQEPAVMKRVEFKGKSKKTGKTIVKVVLSIYNKETGKFISFAKETKFGNSYYPTKEEQESLKRIREANWLTDDLKDFAYIPKEKRAESENKIKEFGEMIIAGQDLSSPEDTQFYENNKGEIEAYLSERAAETTPTPKAKPQVLSKQGVVKPELVLEELPAKFLDAKVKTIIENEETGEEMEQVVPDKKLQAEIKKKLKLLEKLNDCIHG